jgi:hypothetical protein
LDKWVILAVVVLLSLASWSAVAMTPLLGVGTPRSVNRRLKVQRRPKAVSRGLATALQDASEFLQIFSHFPLWTPSAERVGTVMVPVSQMVETSQALLLEPQKCLIMTRVLVMLIF